MQIVMVVIRECCCTLFHVMLLMIQRYFHDALLELR